MKTFQILSLAALSLLFTSCGNSNKTEEKTDERYVEKIDEHTGVASLQSYQVKDSIKVNGKTYQYSFSFHPVDSLPHITYISGTEYQDNAVDILIQKNDGTNLLKRSFSKSSFKSYIPEKLYSTSGLIGFTYNIDRQLRKEFDAFYFIATIGNLDDAEEIAFPLEIRIDTDGGMAIQKYEELETEPLRGGLSVDPSTDDGV